MRSLTGLFRLNADRPASRWGLLARALQWALGIGLLVVSLSQVDLASVHRQVIHASLPWVAAALASVFLSTGLKLLRWRWLLTQFGAGRQWRRAAGSYLVGQSANFVLPIRAGDVIRVGWLSADTAAPSAAGEAAAGLGAILIEKYLDLAALVALTFFMGVELLGVPVEWHGLALAAATLLIAAGIWAGPPLWRRLSRWLAPKLPRLFAPFLARLDRLVDEIQSLRRPKTMLTAASLTALIWAVMLLTNLLVLGAFDLPLDPKAAALVLALVLIGVAPAVMPGNVGPFYFFAMTALQPFGIDDARRLAYAVVLHAAANLPVLLLTAAFLIFQPATAPPGQTPGQTPPPG